MNDHVCARSSEPQGDGATQSHSRARDQRILAGQIGIVQVDRALFLLFTFCELHSRCEAVNDLSEARVNMFADQA